MVEELAEDREQRVERRRQADVGRDVRDEQRLVRRHAAVRRAVGVARRRVDRARHDAGVALGAHREAGGRDGGGVGGGLVDDQVADHARLGVEHEARVCAYEVGVWAARGQRGRSPSASWNTGVVEARERLVGGTEVSWPGCRLLHEPSTVRRPNDSSGLGIWSGPGPTSAPQGPVAGVVLATWSRRS